MSAVKGMRTPLIVTKGRESGNKDSTQEHFKIPEWSPLKRSYTTVTPLITTEKSNKVNNSIPQRGESN